MTPFVIYADFESIIKPIPKDGENNTDESYTEEIQRHIGCGHSYKLISAYNDEFSKPIKVFRGERSIERFIKRMLIEVDYCKGILRDKISNHSEIMTKEDKIEYESTKKCYKCGADKQVSHHNPFTGKYLGAVCVKCNKESVSKHLNIPVVFHNLRGYDSHLIMLQIGKIARERELSINVIPNNQERFMAFII